MRRTLGKRAEAASETADVGVIDVAVDDIAHAIAAHLAPQRVGRFADPLDIVFARGEQRLQHGGIGRGAIGKRAQHAADLSVADRIAVRPALRRSVAAAGRPAVVSRPAIGVAGAQNRRKHRLVEPARAVANSGRINRQTLDEAISGATRGAVEDLALGPWGFRIDMVRRQRRHAAPVVDPGVQQHRKIGVRQIRRCLDVHVLSEDRARRRNRPQQIVHAGLNAALQRRSRFGAEVLDDDFLNVTVGVMEIAQGEQRIQALLARLADPDQDAAGERDCELSGHTDHVQTHGGNLVRRAVMHLARSAQPVRRRFQHEALRRRNRTQCEQIVPPHDSGVDMRQKTGFLQNDAAHLDQIGYRRGVTHFRKLAPRRPMPQLGLVTEGEKRFGAAKRVAFPRDVQNLFRRHVRACVALMGTRERAIMAIVPAELGQRNKDLGRKGLQRAVTGIPQRARLDEQLAKAGVEKTMPQYGTAIRPCAHRCRIRPAHILSVHGSVWLPIPGPSSSTELSLFRSPTQ